MEMNQKRQVISCSEENNMSRQMMFILYVASCQKLETDDWQFWPRVKVIEKKQKKLHLKKKKKPSTETKNQTV